MRIIMGGASLLSYCAGVKVLAHFWQRATCNMDRAIAKSGKAKADSKGKADGKFCLLLWLEGEQVGVVPSSSIRPGQNCYVGAIGEFKWQTKYYEGEILKVSGNVQLGQYTAGGEFFPPPWPKTYKLKTAHVPYVL